MTANLSIFNIGSSSFYFKISKIERLSDPSVTGALAKLSKLLIHDRLGSPNMKIFMVTVRRAGTFLLTVK